MVNRHLNQEFSSSIVVYLYQNANRLIDSIVTCSEELGYSVYVSSEREAWRASINGLNDAIREYTEQCSVTPEVPYRPTEADSLTAFGIAEAHKHKKRKIEPPVFLGLYKYFVWAYLDTLEDFGKNEEEKSLVREFIIKVFAKIEHALVVEWLTLPAQNDDELAVEE
jgi:hypothetical protein